MATKWIYKRLMDLFTKGDLIRIKQTGEVFIYHSSTGGANFSSYLVFTILDVEYDYNRSLMVHEVEKVNSQGQVVEIFTNDED